MPTYKELNLEKLPDTEIIEYHGVNITVKTYLPFQEKMILISNIINLAGDDNGFYNSARLAFHFDMEMLKAYTDIEFEGEDAMQVYDELTQNEFFGEMYRVIPQSELDFIYNNAVTTIDRIYQYRNSVYGILDAMKTDYSNLDFDIEKLRKNLADGENVEFLKEVLDKMG